MKFQQRRMLKNLHRQLKVLIWYSLQVVWATTLCETAKRSIGLKKGSSAAQYEMKLLLEDYEYKKAQLDAVMEEIEKLCRKIPESEQMLAIKSGCNQGDSQSFCDYKLAKGHGVFPE